VPYLVTGGPCAACRGQEGDAGLTASSHHAVAFVAARQAVPGTMLVSPRRHVVSLSELTRSELHGMWQMVRSIAAATAAAVGATSLHLSQYAGSLTVVTMDHLHWRIEPRFPGSTSAQSELELPSIGSRERDRQSAEVGRRLGAWSAPGVPLWPRSVDCKFCRRLWAGGGWIATETTDRTVTYVANRQRSHGSLIVIPRRHVFSPLDLTQDEASRLVDALARAVRAIESAYDPDGLHLWQGGRQPGPAPHPHLHVRICPRYSGQPYTFGSNESLPKARPEELRVIAAEIGRGMETSGGQART
jgi:histidine triad (HIT) family protein